MLNVKAQGLQCTKAKPPRFFAIMDLVWHVRAIIVHNNT